MKKKQNKIVQAVILVLLIQVSCTAPELSYSTAMPTPILAEVPKIVTRGETHQFSITTVPDVECRAGIGYYGHAGKWTIVELPTIESDENGTCEWAWEIPEDAQDGLGEFRARIQNEDDSHNTFPATFCIGSCP